MNIASSKNGNVEDTSGPNVVAALAMSPTEAQKLNTSRPHKSTIGQRKPASKVSYQKT